MKKLTLFFLLIFAIAKTNAQNYQISFAGTGAASNVDSVKVENLTQCTDTIIDRGNILHLIGAMGINEFNSNDNYVVRIYPNPMTAYCAINFEVSGKGKTSIALFDIAGKRILFVEESLSKGNYTYCLSGIGSGAYTLKIESNNFVHTAKIISCNTPPGNAEIKRVDAMPVANGKTAASNTGEFQNSEGNKTLTTMQYNAGDLLKFTGYSSGVYSTVFMLVPTQSQTVTFNFVPCTDTDNNHYSIVQIDTIIWMAENLKTTKFSNGMGIASVTDNNAWGALSTAAYCWYNNDSIFNKATFGALYNGYAVYGNNNVCPSGWHLATDAEWASLVLSLDSNSQVIYGHESNLAGGMLKETCSANWLYPNFGATNESGFTALPAGWRYWQGPGTFLNIGTDGIWWADPQYDAYDGWIRNLDFSSAIVCRLGGDLSDGFSVRCVKN